MIRVARADPRVRELSPITRSQRAASGAKALPVGSLNIATGGTPDSTPPAQPRRPVVVYSPPGQSRSIFRAGADLQLRRPRRDPLLDPLHERIERDAVLLLVVAGSDRD